MEVSAKIIKKNRNFLTIFDVFTAFNCTIFDKFFKNDVIN